MIGIHFPGLRQREACGGGSVGRLPMMGVGLILGALDLQTHPNHQPLVGRRGIGAVRRGAVGVVGQGRGGGPEGQFVDQSLSVLTLGMALFSSPQGGPYLP